MNSIGKRLFNELPFFTVIIFVVCLFLPLNSFASQIDESKGNNQFASNDIELESLKKNYNDKTFNHVKLEYIEQGFEEQKNGLLTKNFKILKPGGSQVDIINLNSSYVIVSIKLIGVNGASLICADWRIKDNQIEIQPFSKITVDFACPADSLQMSQLKKIISYKLVLVDKYTEEERERRKEAERKKAAEIKEAAERAAAQRKEEAQRKETERKEAAQRKEAERKEAAERAPAQRESELEDYQCRGAQQVAFKCQLDCRVNPYEFNRSCYQSCLGFHGVPGWCKGIW